MERNLRLLGLGTAVRWFGTAMVYPYVGLYLRNMLGVGYAEIGVILLAIAAAPLAVAPFGGFVVDRVGRRKVLLLALGAETASVLGMALSMRSAWFPGVVLGGMAAGVAGNMESPASSAYVADYASGSDRTKAFSWIRIGFNVGFTIGVASGGLLIGFLGFPGTGVASAILLGSATLTLLVSLTPSPYESARHGFGSGLISHTASPRPGSVKQSAQVLAHDRNFLLLCLAFAFASMTYSQWNTTFPLFVNTVLKVPYWVLGTALAMNGAIVIFGQAPITHLMTGRKHTSSAIGASALLIAGFVALGSLSLFKNGVLIAVFAFVMLITLGENLGALPFMTMPSNLAPPSEIGAYNGAFNLLSGTGAALAPSLGGLALASTTNPLLTWSLLALPAVPSMLIFRRLGRRISSETNRV